MEDDYFYLQTILILLKGKNRKLHDLDRSCSPDSLELTRIMRNLHLSQVNETKKMKK